MSQGATGVSGQVSDEPVREMCIGDGAQARACTVRQVLDRIGGKWSIGIVVEASQGPVRFTELERRLDGISRRMLTLTLRNLERDGLLERTVYPTVPPKVEYTATPMAAELYETLVTLTNWAERHRDEIATARAEYDARESTVPAG
ncbi:winged helix-turn-helix transcriptional regulator [Modestobacter versicolor]|uniref:DNA-binding HxlR family transcriptional regulator n=2 Tax=Modestobacter versicolor TaxID=429133 RepID=A0A839Y6B9_9ACTN|nr:helix-turn-helix domain-containing protein [Modestobacter versicolor]MBB3676341.1 DNA-binding HxlR family transcriptional regulator [Modestobacter versicolor]